MTDRDTEIITVEVELLHQTEAAYKVASCETGRVVWVPKSQSELQGDGLLSLPMWLAVDKGLV